MRHYVFKSLQHCVLSSLLWMSFLSKCLSLTILVFTRIHSESLNATTGLIIDNIMNALWKTLEDYETFSPRWTKVINNRVQNTAVL